MNKKQRKYKVIKEKLIFFVILLSIFATIFFLEYDFENSLYNGVILLVVSFILAIFLGNDKFYIDFGIKDSEIEESCKKEEFKIFNTMHPFVAIYNRIISFIFFALLAISLFLIVSSFFGQGE